MSNETEQTRDMIQAIIKVHGTVQKVGYRKKVNHLALGLDLRGFVGNLEDPFAEDDKHQPVGIICQGSREKIRIFLKLIEVRNGYINVEKVEVSCEETFAMRYPEFYILRGEAEDELGPRLDTAVGYLKDIRGDIRTGNKELKNAMNSGFENMGEKIDRTNENLGGKIDRTNENIDRLGEKIDKGFDSIGEKIDSGFDNMGKKIDRTSENIDNMNENLGKKIDGGIERNHQRFDGLEAKHHTMAEELKCIGRAAEGGVTARERKAQYRYGEGKEDDREEDGKDED
ncbi:MAG: acylphosphatase [Thermoplasmata archaeon]|nr:acylphosphatase [Thermoplasmata archaeon]